MRAHAPRQARTRARVSVCVRACSYVWEAQRILEEGEWCWFESQSHFLNRVRRIVYPHTMILGFAKLRFYILEESLTFLGLQPVRQLEFLPDKYDTPGRSAHWRLAQHRNNRYQHPGLLQTEQLRGKETDRERKSRERERERERKGVKREKKLEQQGGQDAGTNLKLWNKLLVLNFDKNCSSVFLPLLLLLFSFLFSSEKKKKKLI